MPKGKPKQKRDRQSGMQRKHELEMARVKADNELMRDIVKYVGEDLRSQLLLVALTGTSIAALTAAYKKSVAENEVANQGLIQEVPHPPIWMWALTGPVGLVGSVAYSQLFVPRSGGATTPWGIIDGMQAAATSISGLAWAALFASIILGEGGLGGLLDKAGGGGFGQVASLAGAV